MFFILAPWRTFDCKNHAKIFIMSKEVKNVRIQKLSTGQNCDR